MQRHSVWLELRSGAPGLDGPFIQEFRSPYQLLQYITWRNSPVIMVIGGKVKRQHFTDCYVQSPVEEESGKICLRRHRTRNVLVIDCEMHVDSRISRVLGGPCPGHYYIHRIENAPPTIPAISDRIYLEVLAPLSRTVLLFMEDFGGLSHTISFLVSWVYRAMTVPGMAKLHVHLILSNEHHGLTNAIIWFEISTGLLDHLHAQDPTKAYSLRRAHEIGHSHLQLDLQDRFTEHYFSGIVHHLQQSQAQEKCHSPLLYHKALIHFAKHSPQPFNVAIAYADTTPLPEMWQDHVVDLIMSCQTKQVSPVLLLSSAFALHTFKKGLNCE